VRRELAAVLGAPGPPAKVGAPTRSNRSWGAALSRVGATIGRSRAFRLGVRTGLGSSAVAAPQEFQWHERVRRALDFKIENPDFFVWIVVEANPGAGLDEQALRRNVEDWLGKLDADRVFQERGEPEHTWEAGGLVVRFTAIPKKPEARGTGVPIVGNPVSRAAYWSGFVRGDTGVPVIAPPSTRPGPSHPD